MGVMVASPEVSPPDASDTETPEGGGDAPGGKAGFFPTTARGWIASVVAMLWFAGAVGYVVGARSPDTAEGGPVDVGFLQDMITHHEQAIEMSNIELADGAAPGVQAFAREILTFQAYEIGIMEAKLAEWGHVPADRSGTAMAWMDLPLPADQMPGLASEEEMDAFGRAEGNEVDALFVRLMQDHHRGGAHMADYAADAASDRTVRELAGRMARNQRIEIGELEGALEREGLNPMPDGFVPAEIPAGHTGHHG